MIYLLLISLLVIVVLAILLRVAVKRLLQYDKMLKVVSEDVEINLHYLNEMLENHVSTNAPEIIELDRNLKAMRDRFIEVADAMNKQIEESAQE